jgi:pilus assembly protein Flp/PilA
MKKSFRKAVDMALNFLKKEDGPTAVEYAVMLALIVVVCIAAITALGSNTNSTFSFVGSSLKPPTSTSSSSS